MNPISLVAALGESGPSACPDNRCRGRTVAMLRALRAFVVNIYALCQTTQTAPTIRYRIPLVHIIIPPTARKKPRAFARRSSCRNSFAATTHHGLGFAAPLQGGDKGVGAPSCSAPPSAFGVRRPAAALQFVVLSSSKRLGTPTCHCPCGGRSPPSTSSFSPPVFRLPTPSVPP
jgi:hypothetical protein